MSAVGHRRLTPQARLKPIADQVRKRTPKKSVGAVLEGDVTIRRNPTGADGAEVDTGRLRPCRWPTGRMIRKRPARTAARLRLQPCRSVKTTLRVDSQSGRPPIHTAAASCPRAQRRPAPRYGLVARDRFSLLGAKGGPSGSAITPSNGQRSTYDRTGMRKRCGGPMRTSALRRCAPGSPPIGRRNTVCWPIGPAGRGIGAARSVAGATPLAKGSVRVRGEVEIHTSPLPSRGRSRTIDPCGKAIRTPLWDAADQPILLRLPLLPQRLVPCSPARVRTRSRRPRPHTATLPPDTATRVCHYVAPAVWVSPPVHGDRCGFEEPSR